MTQARCPYFGKCGGCSSQHIDYETQLENKKQQLIQAIRTKTDEEPEIKAFSGSPYGYRNRMDFIFHPNGLGFRAKGQWKKIIDIKECPISNKRLNELLKETRDFFKEPDAFDVKKHSGTFRYAVIRTPQKDSSISFVLNSDSSRIKEAIEKIKEFSKTTTAKNIIVTYVPAHTDHSISEDFFVVKGSEFLKETYLDKTFEYHVQGFFQNNYEIAEKMHEYIHQLAKEHDTKKMTLLDLYGGVGTFGIINAPLFKEAYTIESFPGCTESAKKNIEQNKVKNIKAITLDAKKLKDAELSRPLFVITDPPRSGMNPKTIKQLNRLKPEVIIYISCNLNQLGKELPRFIDYKIRSAALFDMFPQTPHCEGVVELVREQS